MFKLLPLLAIVPFMIWGNEVHAIRGKTKKNGLSSSAPIMVPAKKGAERAVKPKPDEFSELIGSPTFVQPQISAEDEASLNLNTAMTARRSLRIKEAYTLYQQILHNSRFPLKHRIAAQRHLIAMYVTQQVEITAPLDTYILLKEASKRALFPSCKADFDRTGVELLLMWIEATYPMDVFPQLILMDPAAQLNFLSKIGVRIRTNLELIKKELTEKPLLPHHDHYVHWVNEIEDALVR